MNQYWVKCMSLGMHITMIALFYNHFCLLKVKVNYIYIILFTLIYFYDSSSYR